MNPGPKPTPAQIPTGAGIALLATITLLIGGLVASMWTGAWLILPTAALIAVIPLCVAAWFMAPKVEST